MNNEKVKLEIIGQIDLSQYYNVEIPELAKVDLDLIPEETRWSFEEDLSGVLENVRPREYFVHHSFFSDILPTVEECVGEKSACDFLELVIYSNFCRYKLDEYISCLQEYWVSDETNEAVLNDSKLCDFWDLCCIVRESLNWTIRRKGASVSKQCTCVKRYSFRRQNTKGVIIPNEYYYKTMFNNANKCLPKYRKLSRMLLNDLVDAYIHSFAISDNYPYTRIVESLELERGKGGPLYIELTSPGINKYQNNPLAFVYLIALAKASGDLKINNNAVLNKLSGEYVNAFRDLFWICDKYSEHGLAALYPNVSKADKISEYIKLYNKDHDLEEGRYIRITPDEKYLPRFKASNSLYPSKQDLCVPLNEKFKMGGNIIGESYIKCLCEFYVIPELLQDCDSTVLGDIENIFLGRTAMRSITRKYKLKQGKKGTFTHFLKFIYKNCNVSLDAWRYFNEYFIYGEVPVYGGNENPTSNAKKEFRDKVYYAITKVLVDHEAILQEDTRDIFPYIYDN